MAKLKATSVAGNLTVTGKVTSTVAGATTSTIGTVKLNNTTNSTSTTEAATAAAVKAAYDKGNHSHPYAPTSHGNHVPTTQTASNSVFLRNDNTWQTVRPDSIGAMKGSSIEGTTGATAGWYRIAQSAVDINNNTGIFMIRAAASGKHSSTTLSAGVTYGQNPIIQQISHTQYSGTGISKARVVYHATYSGNRAYLEVYIPDATARPIIVQLIGALGWSLLSPSTAGSVPSGYTNKEITLATGKIVSDINGTVNGYSIAKSVPSDAKFTDTNTWRPVVDNLTSTATDQSLSANQGKVLKGLVDGKANSSHGTHVSYGTSTTGSTYGGAAAAGTASTVSRSDHKHALPALPTASTSASGIVKLNSATNSVSTTEAATASAVKAAYDKGNHSHPYLSTSGGALTGALTVEDINGPSGSGKHLFLSAQNGIISMRPKGRTVSTGGVNLTAGTAGQEAMAPITTREVGLGLSTNQWKNLYVADTSISVVDTTRSEIASYKNFLGLTVPNRQTGKTMGVVLDGDLDQQWSFRPYSSSVGSLNLGAQAYPWNEIWLKAWMRGERGITHLPNGVIIQWGRGSGTSTVSFPVVFPSECSHVFVDGYLSTSSDPVYKTLSAAFGFNKNNFTLVSYGYDSLGPKGTAQASMHWRATTGAPNFGGVSRWLAIGF